MPLRRSLSNRQKLIAGVVVVAFILIITYAITVSIQRSGKIKTTVKFAPYTATVKLNETRIANNSTVWLEPGDYHLTVNLDEHFESYQEDITISADFHSIYGTLAPTDTEGEQYAERHRTDYLEAEGLVSAMLNQEGDVMRKKYPILNYLPVNTSLYSISYEEAEDLHPIVHIKTDLENIDTAIAKLKSFSGVDISALDLVFDYESPFQNPNQNPIQNPADFIKAAYNLSDNYVITEKEKTDNFYCATIYISDYKEDYDYAHYRIILTKNKDNNWEVPFAPQPLFTSYNTKDLSAERINTINSY